MSTRKKIAVLLLLLTSSYLSFAQTAVGTYGQLAIDGRHVVDQNNNPVQLQGMSLFWSNWSPAGDGGNYWTRGAVQEIRDEWCANIVRAAMGVEDPGGYLQDPNGQKQKVIDIIEAAIDLDMYVIIDWHSHHAEDHQQEAIDFFTEMAQTYGDYPNIIYEIYNEPLNVSWSHTIKPYSEAVIEAIREHDSNNIIVCGTPNWSQDVDDASNDPIEGYDNIAYTLHYYAGTHEQWLRDKANIAMNRGIAIMVTEYGLVDADGDGGVSIASSNQWYDWMEANMISHCNWSLHDKEEGASALQRNASTQGNWTYDDDLTASGTFVRNYLIDNCPDYDGIPAPVFSTQPQTTTGEIGESVTFSAEASGEGAVTYQWYLNDEPIEGATESSYTISSISQEDAGAYHVVATSEGKERRSAIAYLILDDPDADQSGSICSENDAKGIFDDFTGREYSESTDGEPARGMYWWTDDNAPMVRNTSAGEISVSLTREEGQYQPIGFSFGDDAGDETGNAYTVDFSEDFTYEVHVRNDSDYDLVFALSPQDINGNQIDADAQAEEGIDDNVVQNPWQYSIQITVPARSEGVIGAGASNGTIELSGTFEDGYHVYENPHCNNAEGCTAQEFDFSQVTGFLITVTNAANTGDPHYLPLPLDNAEIAITEIRFGVECEENGSFGPTIDQQPQDLTVDEGEEAVLSVQASGSEELSYQWYFNGEEIEDATEESYTIAEASSANTGNYHVVVTMGTSSVESETATLIVQTPELSIDHQTEDQTVEVGEDAVLSVNASGDGTLSFQWYFNGEPIEGATESTLNLNNVSLEDAGEYHVVVISGDEQIESDKIVVEVEDPLSVRPKEESALTIYPNPVVAGQTLKFSKTIHNAQVYDALGSLIDTSEAMDELNTSNLSPGIYIIISEEGTQRFIVK
ncbi:cellulase family glycosylhydrolase [Cytophagaceae bacterium ABcell3]|nr:cellulase family glycosylhydrolase [Cytophagaceae bacterium ABcell3]